MARTPSNTRHESQDDTSAPALPTSYALGRTPSLAPFPGHSSPNYHAPLPATPSNTLRHSTSLRNPQLLGSNLSRAVSGGAADAAIAADHRHANGGKQLVAQGSGKLQNVAAAGGDASLLATLPPDQRLVMEWSNISCWATGITQDNKISLKPLTEPVMAAYTSTQSAFKKCYHKPTDRQQSEHHDAELGVVNNNPLYEPIKDNTKANPDGTTPSKAPAPAPAQLQSKQILHSINGHVLPGGRAPAQLKLEGSVTLNGARLSKATRRRLGFVLQDDILYESLTVHETLTFSGLLRLPKTMTREEKMRRIDAVMAVLGLAKARDTIIGGYFRRGVSGGERKRVSVGQELLINPSVLLLDEPTSGLDSTTALHLVKLLHDLAAGGRAILTTIHQPSSRLYHHLDKVMLLAEGHVMYMGDGLLAADWFGHLGFPLPYGINLADHLLDCAMGEVQYDPTAPGACVIPFVKTDNEDSATTDELMHGKAAIHSLYQTFESWYAHNPSGFSLGSSGDTSRGRGNRQLGLASSRELLGGILDNVKLVPSKSALPEQHLSTAQLGAVQQPAVQNTNKAMPGLLVGKPVVVSSEITAASPRGDSAGMGNDTSGAAGRDQQNGVRSRGVGSGTDANGQQVSKALDSNKKTIVEDKPSKGRSKATATDDTPFFEQVIILWKRALKVRRFESLSGQQLFQLTAVAVITGLLWWQRCRQHDLSGANDALGLLFFELVFVAFRSLFTALFTFPNEFRILSKERPSGNPKLSAYYVARTLADLPIEVLFPSLFIIIVYWFGGLRPTAGAFFSNWASTLLVVLTAQSWGLLIGGLFMDPKTAQSVTTVIMLTFMLVGGFYVRNVPVWIGWIKYLSFLYWGNNLLLKIQFMNQDITDCDPSAQTSTGGGGASQGGTSTGVCTSGSAVQAALRLPVSPDEAVYPEVLVILGMLAILRYATWLVLKWKINSSQRTL